MKIVINLDTKRELLFEAIRKEMNDPSAVIDMKMTEERLARMCFDQGLERVAKAVGVKEGLANEKL